MATAEARWEAWGRIAVAALVGILGAVIMERIVYHHLVPVAPGEGGDPDGGAAEQFTAVVLATLTFFAYMGVATLVILRRLSRSRHGTHPGP